MNKLIIIGNLVADPELRSTTQGTSVCNFTVAVNKLHRMGEEQKPADFFRVTAWRDLADRCAKYLVKGKKVCVVGGVGATAYISRNTNEAKATLEVNASEVEFLSSGNQPEQEAPAMPRDEQSGMDVVSQEDLPF